MGIFSLVNLCPRLWLCAGHRNYSARNRLSDCCLRDQLVHRLTTVGPGGAPMVLGSGDQRQGLDKSEHVLAWESKMTGKTGKKVPLGTADRDGLFLGLARQRRRPEAVPGPQDAG